MKTSKLRRFKVLALLGLPLIALAVVVVMLSMSFGSGTTTKVSAANPGTSFSMNVRGAAGCDTALGNVKCSLSSGSPFVLEIRLNSLPTGVTNYAGFDILVTYSGVTSVDNASTAKWPDCVFPAAIFAPGSVRWGCAIGIGAPNSTFTGAIGTNSFNCAGSGAINLVHGATDTNVDQAFDKGGAETLTINCAAATATPPPPPTATPAPFPRWLKQQRYPFTDKGSQNDASPQDPALDDLGNLWLTRQGAKIPPLSCPQSTDQAVFSEVLSFPPRFADPKGVHDQQFIGAFEFEVRFDPKLICVNLAPGEAAGDLGLTCFVDDKNEGRALEGIARMGCVSKGKAKREAVNFKTKGPELAQVHVHPQPELYSQIRPNQDNGIMVQLLDQNCELSDEQGHPMQIFSCEDAAITVRYLEGDVEPDCQVDALDQQNIAFRWGAGLGSLLYNSRFDLEPSGTVKGDGDIDIKDLQFVFGRHGSNCDRQIDNPTQFVPAKSLPTDARPNDGPHPRQAPVNPNGSGV